MKYQWDVETLKRFRAAGLGRYRIAKIYGCDDTTVRQWLRKAGLPTVAVGPKKGRKHELDQIVREARM